MMDGYIKDLRDKVGKTPLVLNFSAACIVNKSGEILLQKRGDENGFEKWGIPGGAWEFGESAEVALKREVKEETGINISIKHLIGVYSLYFSTYSNGDKSQTVVTLFECVPTSGNFLIDGKETLDLKYFDKKKLPTIFNMQHTEMINDWKDKKRNIYK